MDSALKMGANGGGKCAGGRARARERESVLQVGANVRAGGRARVRERVFQVGANELIVCCSLLWVKTHVVKQKHTNNNNNNNLKKKPIVCCG
jgi:hypothetical protein